MRRASARTISVLVICLAILSSPAMAEFRNFGVYQDTGDGAGGSGDGILNSGDTFLGGFMNWVTFDSASSSYNYGDHFVEDNEFPDPLNGFEDLTGAPWASSEPGDDDLAWLPISNPDFSDDDVLHIYMVWSDWDNTSEEGIEGERTGFALALIANSFIRSRSDDSASGGYDLDIAIHNDDSSLPQVTLSDDYIDKDGNITGRPPAPGTLDPNALEQEFYKTTDPGGEPYEHYFEGRWEYTASTTDGGVISGINHDDYDILINPLDIVTSVTSDGLVIRIDPQAFDQISKIIIYDFGYDNGGYDESNPFELEIPLGTAANKTFFIASIPEVIPEPSTILSLLIMGTIVGLRRRARGKTRT